MSDKTANNVNFYGNVTEFKDLIDELHKNMIEYRNIPCEKQADDFAHSHILDALNAYQKYMNNLS